MSENEFVDVLLYSDDATTRKLVIDSVGRRAARGLPKIRWDETATAAAVVEKVENGEYALLVLDGEAAKAGGMALCRQLKQEIFECPRAVVLTGRPQDEWLARWSEADESVPAPFDALQLQTAVARQLSAALPAGSDAAGQLTR